MPPSRVRFGAASAGKPGVGEVVLCQLQMIFKRVRLLAVLFLIGLFFRTDFIAARSQGQRPLAVSVSPAVISQGDVIRIDVTSAGEKMITGTLFGKDLTFSPDKQRGRLSALAGVDLETKPGKYGLRIDHGTGVSTDVSTRFVQVHAKEFRVRRLRVPDTFVNPPAEAVAQINSDNKLLAAAYAQNSAQLWGGAFELPVDGAPTSNFGTRSYYNGVRRSPHAGVDFMSEPGTPIRASNHGTVALAAALYFTGNTVIIDHGARLFSVFAHLSEVHVKASDVVTPETIVGLVGATGRVTGPHLHWSVRLNGARVDPLSLIAVTQVQ
jgi:murein DD-endopeptidase MepM/ murein hydrolase activator NlpD